ncbi:hypothetical protein TTHERM_000526959 (macronuclear) [Tetrahymena thermophila SB210]|uniref:Uncharacterized protein n=1 Tax=Tetrahymena thermophila (strain SB210) TaxID=312017 RepID=W7WZ97_TETTS|nr:hypothetical protein TTHERM_000526959 [Tetrahymena thermophila SB210]EWS70932.1 hypothetical protein TTHERM_000526959 [Tetrahymena thermophila SB210]|eukprot:XP_012656547.1 hypothetical protein TTHERM_000526959 [Tetrahymena thermophila SB210]
MKIFNTTIQQYSLHNIQFLNKILQMTISKSLQLIFFIINIHLLQKYQNHSQQKKQLIQQQCSSLLQYINSIFQKQANDKEIECEHFQGLEIMNSRSQKININKHQKIQIKTQIKKLNKQNQINKQIKIINKIKQINKYNNKNKVHKQKNKQQVQNKIKQQQQIKYQIQECIFFTLFMKINKHTCLTVSYDQFLQLNILKNFNFNFFLRIYFYLKISDILLQCGSTHL